MTQITGKIYQQTNAAGTENRFPRTVMEAVLGLNSYLQDQFSSLADIYMPIEGINQAKPNQEFVYRKTPNTIKAKALTLDKIKGKTLAWDQLMQNGNFTDGASGWNVNGGTLSVSSGIATISATASTVQLYRSGIPAISSHKYLFKASVKFKNNSYVYFSTGTNSPFYETTGNWQTIAYIDNTAIGGSYPRISTTVASVGDTIQVSCFYVVDLTLLYGSAIDGKTDAEILAMYEADFGSGLKAYNPGELISNDAESLETVGFNQLVSEPQNMVAGAFPAFNKTIYTRVLGGVEYYFRHDALGVANWRHIYKIYDLDGNEITANAFVNLHIVEPYYSPGNAYWVDGVNATIDAFPITFAKDCYVFFGYGFGAVTAQTEIKNICLNLSDPSRNGQYEPYRKSILPLNLNKIRVISPNIWDEEWDSRKIWGENMNSKTVVGGNYSFKNPIRVVGGESYYCKFPSGKYIDCEFYDKNGNHISSSSFTGSGVITTPSNCSFIGITTYGFEPSTGDICINKSDPGFNGKYFPHGILTITTGLNGVGDSYDSVEKGEVHKRMARVNLGMRDWRYYNGIFYTSLGAGIIAKNGKIICSKYSVHEPENLEQIEDKTCWIQKDALDGTIVVDDRSYSDTASFKAAMDGVYLDYELANEEVYDLAEPIPMSMPAGTTEARISPNADGLSAPFCADMTYGMGATEYAETAGVASFALNAQYAEVAARLLTPRTIWGQVFDGSANITGAMTGVSAIDSLMHFDTANGRIGIGISTPLYNLDVAGTFHAAGNAYIGGNVEIHGNIDCWRQMEINALTAPESEFDSEHDINIPLWKIEEDGQAEFANTKIRGLLKLRTYYYDDGTFHDATMQYEYDDEDASNCFISADKSIHAPSFVQSSDARLKTNLSPVALTVEQIAYAPAVEFNWVGNGQRGAGSIAQYWEAQLPYCVHRNGDLLSMEYGNIALISAIVCARKIQELEEQVKKLEAKINV